MPRGVCASLERHRRRGDPEALAEARKLCTELEARAWLAQIEEPAYASAADPSAA